MNSATALWALGTLAAVFLLHTSVRRRRSLSATAPWLFTSAYRASILRRLPSLLMLLAIVMSIGALADPVVPYADVEVRSRGLDIVITVDLSSSMEAEMAGTRRAGGPAETRLQATKAVIKSL